MPSLHIRLTKKQDGSAVLACTREDGSETWQRHHRQADFFPLHDLNHFAVETVLGLRHGFYGLLADGWNITDFGERTIEGELEEDAVFAETLVGLFDQERGTGIWPEADEFNRMVKAALQSLEKRQVRVITQKELDAIRSRILQLHKEWGLLPAGGTMELDFAIETLHGQ